MYDLVVPLSHPHRYNLTTKFQNHTLKLAKMLCNVWIEMILVTIWHVTIFMMRVTEITKFTKTITCQIVTKIISIDAFRDDFASYKNRFCHSNSDFEKFGVKYR